MEVVQLFFAKQPLTLETNQLHEACMFLRARSFGNILEIRIYSGIYSCYFAPGSRIAGMEI